MYLTNNEVDVKNERKDKDYIRNTQFIFEAPLLKFTYFCCKRVVPTDIDRNNYPVSLQVILKHV